MTTNTALDHMTEGERDLFTDAGALVITGLTLALSAPDADHGQVLTASMLLISSYLETRVGLEEEVADWYAMELITKSLQGVAE